MSDKMLQYIHDYLDGEISSEDSQRLEEWLQESRENVRSFVTASHIHRQLRDLTIGDAAHRSLTPLSERPLVRPTESRSTLYISLTVVSLVLVSISAAYFYPQIFQQDPPQTQENQYAQLTGSVECTWIQAPPEVITPNTVLKLESGIARFTVGDQTDILLEGPAELVVISKSSIRLNSGRIWVHVNDSVPGFTVFTPGALVEDVGTTFGVHVRSDRVTEVHVESGMVYAAITDMKGVAMPDKKVPVRANEGALLDVDHNEIHLINGLPSQFVRELAARKTPPIVLHYEMSGTTSWKSMNFSKAERVNLPDSNESQYVVDYDFRLFSTGEFATWFYGTGPHCFRDSIVFELMRVEDLQADPSAETAVATRIHVGVNPNGKLRWQRLSWDEVGKSILLVPGHYRLRVHSREIEETLERVVIQFEILPSPAENGAPPQSMRSGEPPQGS
jgi:ferric-dicitrate binding protein FerR (iron transport regulator)